MLTISQKPYVLEISEPVGIAHDPQVVAVAWPTEVDGTDFVSLQESVNGHQYFMQRSRQAPEAGFLHLSINPHQRLSLTSVAPAEAKSPGVCVSIDGGAAILSNSVMSIKVPYGSGTGPTSGRTAGPILQWRQESGPWRGGTYFDTQRPLIEWIGELLEAGSLRTVYQYSARFEGGGSYKLVLMLDVGQPVADITEEFQCAPGDQLVWTLGGPDLPSAAYLLDTTAGYTRRGLTYHFDQRIARLFSWTQYQQLLDLSDGFAFEFPGSSDSFGLVTLAGGEWRGCNLNHIEMWQRRVAPGIDGSRRLLPADAKADSLPSPDQIPGRGQAVNQRQLTLEAWIGSGKRRFGMAVVPRAQLTPEVTGADNPPRVLGHFETIADRETYRATQVLLRRLHARGMFPLQDQLTLSFVPELGMPNKPVGSILFELMSHDLKPDIDNPAAIASARDYLEARVYGFWEGAGAAYTNCVAGRRIAPEMQRYDALVRQGKLSETDRVEFGAMLLFLAHLFESDNYYPGWTTMEPLGSADATEPSLTGMANQNFYTDVFNVFTMAAEVFTTNPQVPHWRDKFAKMWRRQLEYHMYPESGVWEESHTYYQHVLMTVAPSLLRRLENGTADDFADPMLQKLVAGALKQVSPSDAYFDGARHIVAFGDHDANPLGYRDLYRVYARAFAKHAPTLAGNLAWAYWEMNGDKPLDVAPIAPEWISEAVQGLGYVFRSNDVQGAETMLALRGGSAWGHHHCDDGSIQFFARGRALIGDAAFGNVQRNMDRKFHAEGHSRWSLSDHIPLNHLFRFNRGWVSDHKEDVAFPYAVIFAPVYCAGVLPNHYYPLVKPVAHYRAVIQLSATAYLVLDTSDSTAAQVVRFHVPGNDVRIIDGITSVDYAAGADSTRLQITPLLTGACYGVMAADSPANGKPFNTSEIAYAPDTRAASLFLVTADAPGAPVPDVTLASGVVDVRGAGYGATITLEAKTGEMPEGVPQTGNSTAFWLDGGAQADGIDKKSWLVTVKK